MKKRIGADFFFDDLAQEEGQQFFMITGLREVFAETLLGDTVKLDVRSKCK